MRHDLIPPSGVCPKIPHRNKSQALGHIRSMRRRKLPGTEGLEVYRCKQCGKYHVGHPARWRERWAS